MATDTYLYIFIFICGICLQQLMTAMVMMVMLMMMMMMMMMVMMMMVSQQNDSSYRLCTRLNLVYSKVHVIGVSWPVKAPSYALRSSSDRISDHHRISEHHRISFRRVYGPKLRVALVRCSTMEADEVIDVAVAKADGDKHEHVADAVESMVGLETAPHFGYVFLDVYKRVPYLTHTLTCEQVALPQGDWELEFDDSGMGAVCGFRATVSTSDDQSADGEHFLIADLFSTEVLMDTSGFVFTKDGELKSLEQLQAWYRDATATLEVGPTSAQLDMHAFVFRRVRDCKMRVVWCMSQLFANMKISGYKGKSANWLSHRFKAFETLIKATYRICHIVHSTHGNLGAKYSALPWPRRCLPATSISTCAMLLFLQRWAYADRTAGGLHADQTSAREAAAQIFEGFVTSACEGSLGTLVIEIEVNDSWGCTWPRPPSDEYTHLDIALTGGVFDFSGLSSLGMKSRPARDRKWWTSLMQILVDCPEYKMDAVTFFRSAMPSLAKLCAQLLKHIGLALEASLAASSTDKSKKGSMKSVGFAMKTFEDCLEENEDRALAMYVLAGVQASANKTVFFWGPTRAIIPDCRCRTPRSA